MATQQLNTTSFLEKISDYSVSSEWKYIGDKPCIIDFYTSWCIPCKIIAPILENLAKVYCENICVYKINADEEPELAAAFGVKCLPTLVYCPMEDVPHVMEGTFTENEFVENIENLLLCSLQLAD